ncbi:MAG: inositol monophosphatase family protein [Patescibacteria group bacterium]
MEPTYHGMNGPAIGIVLKELVRRCIVRAQRELVAFEIMQKEGTSGYMDDIVTTVDLAVQEVGTKLIRECLPKLGLIAEEENLVILPGKKFDGCFITFDPIDGTKALARRQSHGISTMVSLVWRGEIISAWIGDIMTGEIFGYRPGSDKVHRIYRFEASQSLQIKNGVPLKEQYILFHSNPDKLSSRVGRAIELFKDIEVSGGSIGTLMARLWKGEVGGVILKAGKQTPWDICPIVGISEKLGFRFFEIFPDGLGATKRNILTEFRPQPSLATITTQTETLIVHYSSTIELKEKGWEIR